MRPQPERLLEETWDDGLRYTEEQGESKLSFPRRRCALWSGEHPEPVSRLGLLTLELRFGATALPVEGYEGVSTPPEHRRRGYMARLLHRSFASARRRVSVVCLFGIDDFYPRYGFVTCVADSELRVDLDNARRLGGAGDDAVRGGGGADLPAMRALYNRVHATRPWTVARGPAWDRVPQAGEWQPGSEVHVVERDGTLQGYVVLRSHLFGWRSRRFELREIVARDTASASALLAYALQRARQLNYDRMTVHEPPDSSVAQVARSVGCEQVNRYWASGGGMGKIVDRERFVDAIAAELTRRAHAVGVAESVATPALAALRDGTLVPDDGDLLRLVVGYQRLGEVAAERQGVAAAERAVAAAWFPGGGGAVLPVPFAHHLDHY